MKAIKLVGVVLVLFSCFSFALENNEIKEDSSDSKCIFSKPLTVDLQKISDSLEDKNALESLEILEKLDDVSIKQIMVKMPIEKKHGIWREKFQRELREHQSLFLRKENGVVLMEEALRLMELKFLNPDDEQVDEQVKDLIKRFKDTFGDIYYRYLFLKISRADTIDPPSIEEKSIDINESAAPYCDCSGYEGDCRPYFYCNAGYICQYWRVCGPWWETTCIGLCDI